MDVQVPVMVQDQLTAEQEGMAPTEPVTIKSEDMFLDGPISRRVAVLDFDTATGALLPGARFIRPTRRGKAGSYEVRQPDDLQARDFNQVSVFGTVLHTMAMYEEDDTLGRRVSWAFGAPQLLVVPRAGIMANAFYERDSHSLQFFSLAAGTAAGVIHSSLSHDIVSHETGHAVLDGVAPGLYDAVTPQSLALHEAVADLTQMVMSARSRILRKTVLDRTGGSIKDVTAFTAVAEAFGRGCDPQGRQGFLRLLLNDRTLDPDDHSISARDGRPNLVSRAEPHDLSEVLTGALYTVMVQVHEARKRAIMEAENTTEFSASGKALFIAAEQFKRMAFRALDYLPPGEVSFADYGRAIIAADQASHPDSAEGRERIREEFAKRHMAPSKEVLDVPVDPEPPAMKGLDLQALVAGDWAAYDFANRHRDLLHIPADVPFRVWPRLDVTRLDYHRGGQKAHLRECIFKVSWDQVEENDLGARFDRRRRVTVGTTLAMEWPSDGGTPRVRAVLTSDRTDRPEEQEQQHQDRTQLLRRLADADLLRMGGAAVAPDGRPLRSVVAATSANGAMRVHGAARMLHIVGEE
jgi:hypothetical protein